MYFLLTIQTYAPLNFPEGRNVTFLSPLNEPTVSPSVINCAIILCEAFSNKRLKHSVRNLIFGGRRWRIDSTESIVKATGAVKKDREIQLHSLVHVVVRLDRRVTFGNYPRPE